MRHNPTAYYNRRCSLCGQFVISEDREALLEEHRFEWSEAIVDEFIAANRHLCIDTDPHGAREWARLADAGLMRPQLDWLIAAELERHRLAGRPAWAVFTCSGTLGTATTALGVCMVEGLLMLGPSRQGRAYTPDASPCRTGKAVRGP